jgi:ubiquinone biosynthesis protein
MSIFKEQKVSAIRVARIAKILVKYGFISVAEDIGIRNKIPFLPKKQTKLVNELDVHQRTKMLLEDLGPTFVKLGQILSTRPDLVGVKLSNELSSLQGSVKPFSYAEVEEIFESEFNKSVGSMFKSFDRIPLASASLSQVHKAVTKEGKIVIVKVQRPNITDKIHQDIQIMHYIARLAEKRNPDLKQFRSPEIVEEFQRSLDKELNFRLEGKNIERFQTMFKGDLKVVIPQYFEELSSSKILTMSFIPGVPLTALD